MAKKSKKYEGIFDEDRKLEDIPPLGRSRIPREFSRLGPEARKMPRDYEDEPLPMPKTLPRDFKMDSQLDESEIIPLKRGGKVSSASKRADGCAVKGKTRGRIV